ncbi:hypothetical protein PCANC_10746 [Puccinia coronata f. sp. avenae]|uniref:Uncharacterized protein n=1 Tax=Puccinia coronata f. sp. avenae TaxID=200324 RepID=A0A2N5VSR2_9BASI|nr:hypothetical protein PCANC_10746 [Puccinia coronata f. sp. avenae]
MSRHKRIPEPKKSLRDPRQSPSSKRKSPGNYFKRFHEPKRRLPNPTSSEQSPSRSLTHSSQQSQGNCTSSGEDNSLIYPTL